MPLIEFHHKALGTLDVNTGANLFSWAYKLNTQSFPTYDGEVVQILSAYIDNLTIEGQVRNYSEMENIYTYFIKYFKIATQGNGKIQYNEDLMKVVYAERGWSMKIRPISTPGLHYGRDVVTPMWRLEAAIIEPDPDHAEYTVSAAMIAGSRPQTIEDDADPNGPWKAEFGRLTADIGYREANPFSSAKEVAFTKEERKLYSPNLLRSATNYSSSQLADNYNNLLAAYENGDVTQGVLRKMVGNTDVSMPVTAAEVAATPSTDPETPSADTPSKSGTPSQSSPTPSSHDNTDTTPHNTYSVPPKVGDKIGDPFPAIARGHNTTLILAASTKLSDWATTQLSHDRIIVVNYKGEFIRVQAMPADPVRLGAGIGYIG